MSEADSVFVIATNEFSRIVGHPMAMIVVCVLLVMTLVTGAGAASLLIKPVKYAFEYQWSPDDMLYTGIGGIFFKTSLYLTILSLFLGITAFSGERSNGSLRVLITKPLYRKDIILGKFLGMSSFIFLVVFLEIGLLASMYLIMYQGHGFSSITDIALRLGFLVILIFLNSSLAVGLSMFFGVLIKNLYGVLICCVSYLYLEWYMQVAYHIGLWFSPYRLLLSAFAIGDVSLLNPQFSFSTWLNAALPSIVLMVLEVIIIVILNCFVFTVREDL
ncbi:hypothetical protein Mtc_0692 [Methanocella conradii HZ254]|uniref:ABC-type transport system involved in multi-copper enzyme maturation, permease component n=1 Tax=Methanocella conradii (strain DSM 24694 / JCM 17849 / CGMCC 1.5162 / HZ254) TaxID=1041930 RepID=H8I8I0_METCZ|nr:ABC transporter permease subunit [Methanocella conradii]AFC99456.1 hypothetical protein Mtc_0692 [Methanocella conradii HZ254]